MTHGPVRISVAGLSDVGRTRDHNEDTFLVADLSTGTAELVPEVREHVLGPRGSLFMVADGMGGAAAGEVASAMAADLIYGYLTEHWATDPEASGARFAHHMRQAVEAANERIHAYAGEHPEVRGMGTTLTAAGAFGDEVYVAQVGDSRAFLVRQGRAFQLTKDQSLMQRLVDAGEISEEEAEASGRRNIILQALGPDPRVKVVLTAQRLRRGDVLVVCSDGLSGQVRRDEIGAHAAATPDLAQLCATLIGLANERGGPDNITVVAARFDGEGLELPTDGDDPGHRLYREEGVPLTSDEMPAVPPPPPPPPPEPAPLEPAPPAEPAAAAPARAGLSPQVGLLIGGLLVLAGVLWMLLGR